MSSASPAQSAPMEPATGVRRMKRAPHELMEPVIATDGPSSSPTSTAPAVEASGATQTLEGAHNAMHAVRVLVR